MNRKVKHRRK